MSENVEREYVVHIPLTYDGSKAVPLVFMLHGTSGSGPEFYENIGWKELSEKENFIVVYPSSLRYKIIDEEGPKVTTKWNTPPDATFVLQAGEVGKDDIKFLRKVIDEISNKYLIDAKRIYLNGFSNGGNMAAKCAIEMGDVLAAVCQNASSFSLDTTYILKRKLPILYQVGDKDYGPGNDGPSIPMHLFDSLISTPNLSYRNGKFYEIAHLTQRHFDLQSEHTIEGDSNFALIATYLPKPNTGGYEYKYIIVKNLAHNYPNGVFHPFDAPKLHWNWMKQYELKDTTNVPVGKKVKVVTKIEDVDREYFIHIPAKYDSTKATPVVFFFHGTNQDGNLFYNISGWNEVADTENIIMVYPSALTYCVIDNGVQKMVSKFNAYADGFKFCSGQTIKDDILFVKTIIQQVSTRFNVDDRRIYTVGFSNGSEFSGRCAIELGDMLAACVSSGGGGVYPQDTVLMPKRLLPIMSMTGNRDNGLLENLGIPGGSVPMGFDALYSKHPFLYNVQVDPYIKNFKLDDTKHSTLGDTNFVVASIFNGKQNNPENIFYLVQVKNLEHEYPNGINHALHGATYHWNWMKQYTLEGNASGNSLTVNLGYGDGVYEKDKAVHIWASQQDDKVFTHWSGDVEYLESDIEYHTKVIMPEKNITVTANYATLNVSMRMISLPVKAAERTKNIQLYLPQKDKLKGLVWFLHGTNGNATNMVYDIEVKQMIDRLMTEDYGIIGITSEESEFDLDFDGDGNHRWTYGVDSNLVDFANIRAIRDTLISRGRIDPSTQHVAYGYSAGGAFSEFVVNILNWRAAVNHNASGSDPVSRQAKVPYIVSISENDRHPDVGQAGNAEARMNIQNYYNRNICAALLEHKKAPLHPERFDRSPLISEQQSIAIFNELKNNGKLDADNYFLNFSDALKLDIFANPQKYPVIVNLSNAQKSDLENQIDVLNAEHNVKADFNGYIFEFIENLCSSTATEDVSQGSIHFYPNPSSTKIMFEDVLLYEIFDMNGILMLKGQSNEVVVDGLNPGVYLVRSGNKVAKLIR